MKLLQPAINQTAFLKLGLQGFEGSGKTHLACDFAKGITKLVGGSKVGFYDTEKGSDFHIERFKAAGIELFVLRSRAFVDLLQVIKEAEEAKLSFLIIDSITHVWRELTNAYMRKKNITRMSMHHWVALKTEWSQFTNLYVNSKLHIAMCGRAGYEYDFDESDDGKKEIVKTGTKMKAEGETGFEPDLLIETLKVPIAEIIADPKAKKLAKGFINRCVVIKDRSDKMNGAVIDRPTFEHFLPVIETIKIGGEHAGVDLTRTSDAMIDSPEYSFVERQKQKEIALEQIKEYFMLKNLDGSSAENKKTRTEKLIAAYGTSSWTAISDLKLEMLRMGLDKLKAPDIGQP